MRIFILVLLLAGTSSFSSAQKSDSPRPVRSANNFTPEQQADRQTKHLQGYLALSEEQVGKVYAFNLERYQTIAAIESKEGKERIAYLKALPVPLQVKYESQLKTVLTPEQVTQYEARKAQQRQEAMAAIEKRRKEKDKALPAGK